MLLGWSYGGTQISEILMFVRFKIVFRQKDTKIACLVVFVECEEALLPMPYSA